MGPDAEARLGEAAVKHGLIAGPVLQEALRALQAERATGRQRTLPLFLFETGVIDAMQLLFLLEVEKAEGLSSTPRAPQIDWTSETIQLPTPAPRTPSSVVPPPPRAWPPPAPVAPAPRTPPAAVPPAATRSSRPTPRPAPPAQAPQKPDTRSVRAVPRVPLRRGANRPRWPVTAIVIACALGATIFGVSLAKRASDERRGKDLLRDFERAAERARDAYAARDGTSAIEQYRLAAAIGRQYLGVAKEHHWDASQVEPRINEFSAAVDRLEKNEERALEVQRDAREARLLMDGGRGAEAAARIDAALARAASYLSAVPTDDPWRGSVSEAKGVLASLKTEVATAPTPAPVKPPQSDEAFLKAYQMMVDLTQGLAGGITPESVPLLKEELLRVRRQVEALKAAIAADDPRRLEVDSWSKALDGWERKVQAAVAAAPPAEPDPPEEPVDPFHQLQETIQAALGMPVSQRPKEALLAIDDALDRIQFYQSTAQADDPRLDELMASAGKLLERRKLAERAAGGEAVPEDPAPAGAVDPAVRAPAPDALEELAKRVRPSVVCVKVVRRGSRERSVRGSGFIVHRSGYVVTCRHILDGAESISVAWDARCNLPEVDAKLVRWTLRSDLAVLKLPPGDYVAIRLSPNEAAIGQPTVAVGCAATAPLAVEGAAGQVTTACQAVGSERRLVELSFGLQETWSGGVLLDGMSMQALGVAVFTRSGPLAGRAFAIPASVLKKELPGLWSGAGYPSAVPAPDEGTGVGDPEACKECRGKGKECPSCYGKAQVRVNCPTCGGQGFLEEYGLKGMKKRDCPRCETGQLDASCSACAGTGVVECKKCGAGAR